MIDDESRRDDSALLRGARKDCKHTGAEVMLWCFLLFFPPAFAFQSCIFFCLSLPNGLCTHLWSRCCVLQHVCKPWNSCALARIEAGSQMRILYKNLAPTRRHFFHSCLKTHHKKKLMFLLLFLRNKSSNLQYMALHHLRRPLAAASLNSHNTLHLVLL